MNDSNFKYILKDLRLEKGVKQKDVAEKCDISPQCISQLELGVRSPTGTTLVALADFFNCSIDYLMGRSDDFSKSSLPPYIPLSNEEKQCITIFRQLPPDFQKHTLEYIQKLANLYQEEQNNLFPKK